MFCPNKTHTNSILSILGTKQVEVRVSAKHVHQNLVLIPLLQHRYLALYFTLLGPMVNDQSHGKSGLWFCLFLSQRLGGKRMALPRACRASTSVAFQKYPHLPLHCELIWCGYCDIVT